MRSKFFLLLLADPGKAADEDSRRLRLKQRQLLAQVERLEALSREVFDGVRSIRGFGDAAWDIHRDEASPQGSTIDPDRIQGVLTVMAAPWIAFLIWIYIDPPGHTSFVLIPTVMTMVTVIPPAPLS